MAWMWLSFIRTGSASIRSWSGVASGAAPVSSGAGIETGLLQRPPPPPPPPPLPLQLLISVVLDAITCSIIVDELKDDSGTRAGYYCLITC